LIVKLPGATPRRVTARRSAIDLVPTVLDLFKLPFAARGPKDRQGRSLRDFDLQARLFKYPCSYLIYSEAFDTLPSQLKDVLYKRLWDILNGNDSNTDFKNIPSAKRTAIREILIQTKPGLPDYWRAQPNAS